MKILHLTLGLGNGGAEGSLYRLICFDQRNQHIVISIMGDGVYGAKLRKLGVEVYSFDVPQGKVPLSIFFKLFKLFRKVKPDVLQTWLYHADVLGGVIGKLAGIQNICWGIRHSNLSPSLNSRATLLLAKTSSHLSSFIPASIISCSHKATQVHIEIGYEASKFVTIANGYDLDNLNYSSSLRKKLRSYWSIDEDCFVFGMVGRWNPQKNHANLIEAVALLSERVSFKFCCVLVGPSIDNENTELLSVICNNGVKHLVKLAGPTNQVAGVMSAFDVSVLPSSGEAFPNVVAESMACSRPVIATDVGDASLIVGEAGWIVQPNNSKALAEAMSSSFELYQSKSSWENLRYAARKRVESCYSIKNMVDAFINEWKQTQK